MADERHSPNAQNRSPPSPMLERPWALTTHDKRHYKQDVARHFTMIRGKKILTISKKYIGYYAVT